MVGFIDRVHVRVHHELRDVLAIKKTFGLRVTEAEEEDAGLDISEHGMYGYPEQFIPSPEYPGAASGPLPAGKPAIGGVSAATTPEGVNS